MAITQNTYTGNGSTVLYSFTFPYLETTDIRVSLNGVDTTAYTLANATTVQFNTAPSNGAAIRIYRNTDDADVYATFFPGSAIRAEDLNNSFTQILYKNQETTNFASSTDASAIQATANQALSSASAAVTTANAAEATANGIAGTANTALSNSTAAVSTANAASATANGIAATANAASTTANAALPKAGGTMTGAITFAGAQPTATTSTAAIVQLSNSISSTSETLAATPKAVKDAKDDAVSTAASGAAALYLQTATAASTYLPLGGGTMTGVITYATAQPRLVVGTAVNPTSGTSVPFTSIPSWAKRIAVNLVNISTNGTSAEVIQIGDSSGYATSGYVATTSFVTGTTSGANSSPDGFNLMGQNASTTSNELSGRVVIDVVGVFGGLTYWACSGVISRVDSIGGTTTYFQKFIAGQKGLSGTLDRIRLTTLTGTATFDGGLVNIIYEG